MGLFGGKKSNTFLGVDVGASSIKIIEFANVKGRAKLMTYGYVEVPVAESGESLLDTPKRTGELLQKVCKDSGCKSTSAMAALASSAVFSTILSIPKAKDKKMMKPLIDAELEKLTPLPLTEMITYSTFLDEEKEKKPEGKKKEVEKVEKKDETKHSRVLVTAAAKTLVQKYIEIFRVAKLELQALDTESFALIRSLIGKDKGSIMIIDLGSKRTNLTVVEKGIPFISRSINIGGDSVTRKIMETMQLSETDAERMKRDLGQMSGEGSDLPGGLPKILEFFIQPLVNEIRYTFELYANTELTDRKSIDKIVLTGGASNLPRVPEYLAEALNLNVYRGDPWARVVFPNDLASVLVEIGPRMSISIGLAMRDIE